MAITQTFPSGTLISLKSISSNEAAFATIGAGARPVRGTIGMVPESIKQTSKEANILFALFLALLLIIKPP